MCTHTHSHTQSHTHKLSPHPMGNRADHVLSPPLSLPQFSRTCKQWHTLVHVSRAHYLAHARTHCVSPFNRTHQIWCHDRETGVNRGSKSNAVSKKSLDCMYSEPCKSRDNCADMRFTHTKLHITHSHIVPVNVHPHYVVILGCISAEKPPRDDQRPTSLQSCNVCSVVLFLLLSPKYSVILLV